MQVSKGVEWAAHACVLLAALPPERALSTEALAEFHEVPIAYLAKQMQALSRAGLVRSVRGAAGGYQLARAAGEISLWDITAAIEGTTPAFRCTEIRQNGPCGAPKDACTRPCGIAASFFRAEAAFRDVLGAMTIADMLVDAADGYTHAQAERLAEWLGEASSRPGGGAS